MSDPLTRDDFDTLIVDRVLCDESGRVWLIEAPPFGGPRFVTEVTDTPHRGGRR